MGCRQEGAFDWTARQQRLDVGFEQLVTIWLVQQLETAGYASQDGVSSARRDRLVPRLGAVGRALPKLASDDARPIEKGTT